MLVSIATHDSQLSTSLWLKAGWCIEFLGSAFIFQPIMLSQDKFLRGLCAYNNGSSLRLSPAYQCPKENEAWGTKCKCLGSKLSSRSSLSILTVSFFFSLSSRSEPHNWNRAAHCLSVHHLHSSSSHNYRWPAAHQRHWLHDADHEREGVPGESREDGSARNLQLNFSFLEETVGTLITGSIWNSSLLLLSSCHHSNLSPSCWAHWPPFFYSLHLCSI